MVIRPNNPSSRIRHDLGVIRHAEQDRHWRKLNVYDGYVMILMTGMTDYSGTEIGESPQLTDVHDRYDGLSRYANRFQDHDGMTDSPTIGLMYVRKRVTGSPVICVMDGRS